MDDYDAIVVLLILKTAIGILGLVGNVLVCVTIGYTKKLHNVTNLMILNLAIADALVSLCSTQDGWLINNPYDRNWMRNITECTSDELFFYDSKWTYYYFMNTFFAYSVLCLTAVTFEQFIGISRPLHYASYFSVRKLVVLLIVVWITPFITNFPVTILTISEFHSNSCQPDRHSTVFSITQWLLFVIPTGDIIGMYIKILNNLKRGAQNLQRVQGPRQELLQARRQVAGAMALVILAFIILVLPGKVCIAVETALGNANVLIKKTILLLLQMNSFINPVLYGFKYKKLRNAFRAMMSNCFKLRRSNKVGQALDLQTVETP